MQSAINKDTVAPTRGDQCRAPIPGAGLAAGRVPAPARTGGHRDGPRGSPPAEAGALPREPRELARAQGTLWESGRPGAAQPSSTGLCSVPSQKHGASRRAKLRYRSPLPAAPRRGHVPGLVGVALCQRPVLPLETSSVPLLVDLG